MYEILYSKGIKEEFKTIPAYQREQILDKIDEQLTSEPERKTRNRKMLEGIRAPWKLKGPLWELRVGELRVFYEILQDEQRVFVHSVRRKPPHKTTEQIL